MASGCIREQIALTRGCANDCHHSADPRCPLLPGQHVQLCTWSWDQQADTCSAFINRGERRAIGNVAIQSGAIFASSNRSLARGSGCDLACRAAPQDCDMTAKTIDAFAPRLTRSIAETAIPPIPLPLARFCLPWRLGHQLATPLTASRVSWRGFIHPGGTS